MLDRKWIYVVIKWRKSVWKVGSDKIFGWPGYVQNQVSLSFFNFVSPALSCLLDPRQFQSTQLNVFSRLDLHLNRILANWRHFVTILAQSLPKLHRWQLWHSWRCFLSIIFSIVPHEQLKPMAIFLKSNLIQEKLSSGFQIKVKVKVNQAPAL